MKKHINGNNESDTMISKARRAEMLHANIKRRKEQAIRRQTTKYSSSHNRQISVIGLGYVGLPIAVAFGRQSKVIGFDVKTARIEELRQGQDRTGEVEKEELLQADILFTNNLTDLQKADFHIIAVPTPIDVANQPDMRALTLASQTVGGILKKGDIVVYESTVFPGATEIHCVPLLEAESGLTHGTDFKVGYSPERINPGDKQHRFETIIKVVSGSDDAATAVISKVYGSVITAGIHIAPSIMVAEAAKVIENTQRDLNIALMNELSLIFHRLNIDTRAVLEAAGTKWNFLKFEPGLVGGHCIGIDPYYLTYRAKQVGYSPNVILAGRQVNNSMGKFIARETIKRLMNQFQTGHQLRIAIFGITFKENIPDVRNTRVIDIIDELKKSFSIDVWVFDPIADTEETKREYDIDLAAWEDLPMADAIILAVPHQVFLNKGWKGVQERLRSGKGLVVDVKACLDQKTIPVEIDYWRL